jgi:alanyl-tRNA synthetase
MSVYYVFVSQSLCCSYKLRRVMRKGMLVSQQKFGVESGLVTELTNYVADSLGEVYPEIRNRLKQVCFLY